MLALGATGLGLGALVLWIATPPKLPPAPQSFRVLDRHGVVLAELASAGTAGGQPVSILPSTLAQAFIAAEDHRYRQHLGVDPRAILRAARVNIAAGTVTQGASTLPMQLARNCWTRPPGIRGKLWEAAWALRLSAHLDKDTLLVEYANRVYYGHQAWGIDAASQAYFDKAPRALSVAQAALLAALLPQPSVLDPSRNPEKALLARDRVLEQLMELGYLDQAALDQALNEPLQLSRPPGNQDAPHFLRLLDLQPGENPTTLDLGLQRQVQALTQRHLSRLETQSVTHAAVVVLDTQSSQVLAYVGSGGWHLPDGQVDGAQARRSPGSTLKPFLYAQAIERREITLATLLSDSSGTWSNTHGAYIPRNYDERDLGPLRARVALATSRNLPAVRLLEQLGLASFHRRLEDLGFALQERPDHYGLALILGSGEVTLLQLASAYATMARQGLFIEAQLTPEREPAMRQVGEPGAWWLTLQALDDPNARAPAFGADSVLEPEHPLAAKTGTSVGWRDNWAVGATPQVVVAVWVGNFDGSPMASVSGVTGAGPLMAQVVELTHDPQGGQQDFPRPKSIARAPICLPSGMAPSEHCPNVVREFFLRGTQPTEPDTWWTLAELDRNGALATGCPGAEPTLLLHYPSSARAWAQAAGQDPWPTQDRSCTAQPNQPATSGRILSPPADSVWYLDPQRDPENQAIALRGYGESEQDLIWHVDEQPVAQHPSHQVGRWVPTPGAHRVALLQGETMLDQVTIWVNGTTKESP